MVLAIARRVKAAVDAEPGMKGVLVRTGDYYIPLRNRMTIARKHKADFFVSIHADAFKDARARGSSVYVLSKRGASSEKARLKPAATLPSVAASAVSATDAISRLRICATRARTRPLSGSHTKPPSQATYSLWLQ